MSAIKYAASLISAGRIAGALLLLLAAPLSASFYILYNLCCASDIIDGYIARKTKTTSRLGEVLDSAADLVLITVVLIIFIPLITLEPWMLCWIGAIAAVRFLSLGIGFAKYRAFAYLHTYANKFTGIVMACFPVLIHVFGITATTIALCGTASLSALEELAITIRAKTLNRNISSVFALPEKTTMEEKRAWRRR